MTYEAFLEEWENDLPFVEVYTSGSTGTPKKISLNKEFLKKSARRTNRFFNITKSSKIHSCISPEFIGGKMMAVRARESGAQLSWEKPSNHPLDHLSSDLVLDLVAIVPSQMHHILDHLNSLPKVRSFIIGGGKIPSQLKQKIADSGINAFETYGMTETASHIALRPVFREEVPFATLPGITVETDHRGCLVINIDGEEKVVTNDLAEIVAPGKFFIRGRIDNIINTGGKKINPEELEIKIGEIVDYPFIITSFPDDKWGEKIVMLIGGGSEKEDPDVLDLKLRKLLPHWQVPKEILKLQTLPRTANGKLLRPHSLGEILSLLAKPVSPAQSEESEHNNDYLRT